MNDYEKIFENFKLLRPVDISQTFIDELNEKEKYSLARYVRTWGYINSLSLELAKDLNLDTEDQSTLLNASILIHNFIFKYEEKTKEIYQEMFETLNSLKAWKLSFGEAGKEAMLDMLDVRNGVRSNDVLLSLSNFPRFDHQIKSFCLSTISNRKK